MKKVFSAFVVIIILFLSSKTHSQIIYPLHCDTLYWSHVPGATWYRLQILLGINVLLDSNHIIDTFFVLHNILPNTQYSARVKAYSPNDSTNWFGSNIMLPGSFPPPVFLGYSCLTHTLWWTKVTSVNYYFLEIFESQDTTQSLIYETLTPDTFKVIPSGILWGPCTFYLKLMSCNSCGHGTSSPIYPFTTCLEGITKISTELPYKFELYQNYPNPFNPTTNFRFSIANFGFVSLKIYDILGNNIAALINENLNPATYEIKWNASNYPSGVYLYKLTCGNFTDVKKMILLK